MSKKFYSLYSVDTFRVDLIEAKSFGEEVFVNKEVDVVSTLFTTVYKCSVSLPRCVFRKVKTKEITFITCVWDSCVFVLELNLFGHTNLYLRGQGW